MSADALKQATALAALEYIKPQLDQEMIIGVGTGSTANYFIDVLAEVKYDFKGAVASSDATAERLHGHGIEIYDLNEACEFEYYIDGADEVDPGLSMIKGGGGALTREKIVAACARQFICIVDGSKQVPVLGNFALPVEVIPMARSYVARELVKLGGDPAYRHGFTTDNGNSILDVHGLRIAEPMTLEASINQITGVVTNGLFAMRGADVVLLAKPNTVETIKR